MSSAFPKGLKSEPKGHAAKGSAVHHPFPLSFSGATLSPKEVEMEILAIQIVGRQRPFLSNGNGLPPLLPSSPHLSSLSVHGPMMGVCGYNI